VVSSWDTFIEMIRLYLLFDSLSLVLNIRNLYSIIKARYIGLERVETLNGNRKVTEIRGIYRQLKIRVAIYCRVSTNHEEQAQSLNNQVSYYKEMVSHHPEWELIDIYTDVQSGKNTTGRAGFKKMLADCFSRKIDLVITKSISRFGRNTTEILDVLNKMRARSIDVFFENENIHTRETDFSFLIPVMEAIAQADSEAKSENIKWGINRSLEKPDSKLYNRKCFGYVQDTEGMLIIQEEEAKTVRMIFDLYLRGYSIIAIIRELDSQGIKSPTGKNSWSKRTIDKMLSNEKYTGKVLMLKTYGDKYPNNKRHANNGEVQQYMVNDSHPIIISEEQFELIQNEKIRRSNIQKNESGAIRKSTRYSMKKSEDISE